MALDQFEDKPMPDFLIIGAPKAATTSIYYALKSHKSIFFPEMKEPWTLAFPGDKTVEFIDPRDGTLIDLDGTHLFDLADYPRLFEELLPEAEVMGEASTIYLRYIDQVIKNLQILYGERARKIKIIAILREPVERAWSHYQMHVRDGTQMTRFEESINEQVIASRMRDKWNVGYDYLSFGLYYDDLEKCGAFFSETLIIEYEELLRDQEKILSKIQNFLGVVDCSLDFRVHNASGVGKNMVLRFLSNLIFEKNVIKSALKIFIKKSFRYRIRTSVGKFLLTKQKIPEYAYVELKNFYSADVARLKKKWPQKFSNW